MIYLSALLLGLAGSLHCVGMCGAIAVALPLDRNSWWRRISGALLYHLGRSITYSIMGVIFGLIGAGLSLAGFQRWLSIITGAVMILVVLFPALFKNPFTTNFSLFSKIRNGFQSLFAKRSLPALLGIGLLNGLLPCGLVYIALAGALGTGGVAEGALFMLVFGIATAPLLFVVSILGTVISINLRQKLAKAIPVIVVIIGLLFILRGLNLGIPFISPPEKKLHLPVQTEQTTTETPSCCHKN